MSEDKLNSEEVPQKFAEWLLKMGCPSEKVPSVDKIAQMCRGQYYMVWRSLMEHVEPKEVIKQKRLQVFSSDMQKCLKKSAFSEIDTSAIVPEELSLWRQQQEVKAKVDEVELQVSQTRKDLDQLFHKISSKISERRIAQQRVQDLQRRVWLLQHVADELKVKQENLQQTKTLADALCAVDEGCDAQANIDKCLSVLRRQTGNKQTTRQTASISMCGVPVASSSLVNTSNDEDESSLLSRVSGGSLWGAVKQRRAALAAALAAANSAPRSTSARSPGKSPQYVLTETASLQTGFGLEAIKNRILIKQTQKRLAAAVLELNNTVSAAGSELAVLGCECAAGEARLGALRAVLADVTSQHCSGDATCAYTLIATVDKAIVTKREELRKLFATLLTTERKIHYLKDCLADVFNGFRGGADIDYERFRNLQLDLPQESISSLRQFYEERQEKKKLRLELSMDLDVSERSYSDNSDNIPTFVDELNIYNKKFNLEKNRKLILESGEKIWIFETVQASVYRLYSSLLSQDVPYVLICPSGCLSRSLQAISDTVMKKQHMELVLKKLGNGYELKQIVAISTKEEEEAIMDKIKKRLNENILSLQKTNKTLDVVQENLKYWSDNIPKKYISASRTIDGKNYGDYESYYIENMSLVA